MSKSDANIAPGTNYITNVVFIDASQSNTIYSASVVQPKAFQTLIIIKV